MGGKLADFVVGLFRGRVENVERAKRSNWSQLVRRYWVRQKALPPEFVCAQIAVPTLSSGEFTMTAPEMRSGRCRQAA